MDMYTGLAFRYAVLSGSLPTVRAFLDLPALRAVDVHAQDQACFLSAVRRQDTPMIQSMLHAPAGRAALVGSFISTLLPADDIADHSFLQQCLPLPDDCTLLACVVATRQIILDHCLVQLCDPLAPPIAWLYDARPERQALLKSHPSTTILSKQECVAALQYLLRCAAFPAAPDSITVRSAILCPPPTTPSNRPWGAYCGRWCGGASPCGHLQCGGEGVRR